MSAELWKSILDVIPDVERWNRNLPRLVAEYGQEFKRFAQAGQLAVVFIAKEGPRRYESVSRDVPVETADKLVRSLSPDSLYKQLIKDKGVQMERVG